MSKNRFFTGLEIAAVILTFGLIGSGLKHYKDTGKLKKLGQETEQQADKIDKQAENIEVLVKQVDELSKKKDEIVAETGHVTEKITKKAGEQFSHLRNQAEDIDSVHNTEMTVKHLKTASIYASEWGNQLVDNALTWSTQYIERQSTELKDLRAEYSRLKGEYETYKVKADTTIQDTKQLAETHKKDAETHLGTVNQLNNKIGDFIDKNGWLSDVLWYGAIGVALYFLITLGGFAKLNKIKNEARESAMHFRRKKNQLVKSVNTFLNVDDIGNETMNKILESNGDVDLDEDDEDDDPVYALRRKKNSRK